MRCRHRCSLIPTSWLRCAGAGAQEFVRTAVEQLDSHIGGER